MVAYATFNGLRLDMLFPVIPGHNQQTKLTRHVGSKEKMKTSYSSY